MVSSESGNYSNSKSEAIPEQTAPGKEKSNPLMVITLPKGKEATIASTSRVTLTISKLADLSALELITKRFSPLETTTQRFVPNYKQAIEKNLNTAYYVIYDGPHQGIYTNWGEVSSYTNGTNHSFKKFFTLEQARKSDDAFDLKKDTGLTFKGPIINKHGKKRTVISLQPKEVFFTKDF